MGTRMGSWRVHQAFYGQKQALQALCLECHRSKTFLDSSHATSLESRLCRHVHETYACSARLPRAGDKVCQGLDSLLSAGQLGPATRKDASELCCGRWSGSSSHAAGCRTPAWSSRTPIQWPSTSGRTAARAGGGGSTGRRVPPAGTKHALVAREAGGKVSKGCFVTR